MKNFIVRTFSDYSDIWIQRSYPSQHWQKSLHPKWTVLSEWKVSILHRHVLALLGPPQSRRSEGTSGGIHAGGSLRQMLRGRVLMFRALGCRCRWIQNTESLHAFLFCFIFSSKALSYFIRWGTQGATGFLMEGSTGEMKILRWRAAASGVSEPSPGTNPGSRRASAEGLTPRVGREFLDTQFHSSSYQDWKNEVTKRNKNREKSHLCWKEGRMTCQ